MKNLKRTVLLLIALFTLGITAHSQVITAERAQQIAEDFFAQGFMKTRSVAPQLQKVWDSSLLAGGVQTRSVVVEEPTFHVFEATGGNGFVIVAGEETGTQIIGYSMDGALPATDDMPEAMVDYLTDIDNQIRASRASGTTVMTRAAATATEYGTPVVELNTATWDQTSPYNKFCYTNFNTGAVGYTGCVPTAYSILMYYYKWPKTANEARAIHYSGNDTIMLGDHEYDWENMLSSYSGSYTEAQATAVATLMRDFGYANGVNFSTGEGNESAYTIVKYFKYKSETPRETGATGAYITGRDIVGSDDTWKNYIKQSLDAGHPIPYSSIGHTGRHIFICDGYTSNDYFHFNWGWSGSGNGYYTVNNMVVDESTQYTSSHKAYFMLMPDRGDVTVTASANVATAGSATVNGEASVTISDGSKITLVATPGNGYTFLNWTLAGKVVSTDATYTPYINGASDYVANFATDSEVCTVTVSTFDTNGSVSITGTTNSSLGVLKNSEVTVIATPNSGYVFTGWYNGTSLVSTDATYTFTPTADVTLSAQFATSVTISLSCNGEGTATIDGASGTTHSVLSGSSVTVRAVAGENYQFVGWYNGTQLLSTNADYTFDAATDMSLVAEFVFSFSGGELYDYVISSTTGTFTAKDGKVVSSYGDYASDFTFTTSTEKPITVTLSATKDGEKENNITPQNGYMNFFSVSGGSTYTISVPEPYRIWSYSFNVTNDLYYSNYGSATITAVSNAKSGNTLVLNDGVAHTFEVTEISASTAQFVITGSNNDLKIENFVVEAYLPTDDGGTETPTAYTVSVASNGTGGSVAIDGTGELSKTVEEGGNVTVVATPANGYSFAGWYSGTTKVSSSASYTFAVSANISLVAEFTKNVTVTEKTPADAVESLNDITLTFDEAVSINGTSMSWATLTNADGTVSIRIEPYQMTANGNVVSFSLGTSAQTTAGEYTLTIPEGIITRASDGSAYSGSITFTVEEQAVVTPFALTSVTPNTTVESLAQIVLEFNENISVDWGDTSTGTGTATGGVSYIHVKSTSGIATTIWTNQAVVSGNTLTLPFESTIYTDGTYTVTIPSGVIFSTSGSEYTGETLTFTIVGPKFTISVTEPVNGTVTIDGNSVTSVTKNQGTTVRLQATPNEGYEFGGWYNGTTKVNEEASYRFTVSEDVNLTAAFEVRDIYIPNTVGTRTKSDHYMTGVTVNGETYTITSEEHSQYFIDKTATNTFTVVAGSTMEISVAKDGQNWVNAYAYIDYAGDGFTASIQDGSNYLPGEDLVSYSFYNTGDGDSSGYNSAGTYFSSGSNDRNTCSMPSFTAPSEPGTYRMRVKYDWCSIDPAGGNADGKRGATFAGLSGMIIDFTLVVEAPTGLTTDYVIATGTGATGVLTRTGGGTSSWKDLFTYTATDENPAELTIQVTSPNDSYKYDMTAYDGGIIIASSHYTKAIYNITVPAPYKIESYSFDVIAASASNTITAMTGTASALTTSTSETKTFSVTDINACTAAFFISGTNNNQTCTNFVVKVYKDEGEEPKYGNGIYTMITSRGWLIYNSANATALSSTSKYGTFTTGESEATCQWVVYESPNTGKYYIYSVAAQKFIGQQTADGGTIPLVDIPTNDIQIYNSTKEGYPFVFSTDNYGAINHNSDKEYGVINWRGSNSDGGLRKLSDDGSAHQLNYVGETSPEILETIRVAVCKYEGYPSLSDEEKALAISNAEALVENWGVGYPNEEAKQTYLQAVRDAMHADEITAAQATLYACTDIMMPEDGKAYYIKAKYNDGTHRYIYRTDAGKLQVMSSADTKGDSYSGVFIFRDLGNGKYALANNNGEYMLYYADGKQGAGSETDGFASSYELGDKDAEITFVPGVTVTSTNPSTIDESSEFFGGFAMQAYNNSDRAMFYMMAGNPDFHNASSTSIYYQGGNRSSIFYLEEVEYANTPELKDITGSTLISGFDKNGLATFSAPFPTVLPEGVTAYYATSDGQNEGYVSLTEYTAAALPANEGFILVGEPNEQALMAPAAGEAVADLGTSNILGNSAGRAVSLSAGQCYLLGSVNGNPGFYACGGGTLAMNKAYLNISSAASRSIVIRFPGATDIDDVVGESGNVEGIYDLTGRKIEEITTPGIYIVNGKKVLVK